MPVPPPSAPAPPRRAPRRSASPPASPPAAPDAAWEDRILGGVDRLLTRSLGAAAPPPAGAKDGAGSKRGQLFSSSWKKAGAVEVIGAALILLFVIVARPSGAEVAGAAASEPDLMEAVAVQASSDGAIVLADGRQVRLLGVALPTDEQPAVRQAALMSIDRMVRGRGVRVEYDGVLPSEAQNPSSTVGYVWMLGPDGRRGSMLNAVLIANGLASPVAGVPYRHATRFQQASQLARARRLGMWR